MNIKKYIVFLLPLFIGLKPINSQEYEGFGEILKSYENNSDFFFISGCNNINSRRGRKEAFILLLTNGGGELFSFRNKNFYREAPIWFNKSTREFIYDPYGGLWNHTFITDVVDYLIQRKFVLKIDLRIKDLLSVAFDSVCDIRHENLDKYKNK